jgi:hypothetical protein
MVRVFVFMVAAIADVQTMTAAETTDLAANLPHDRAGRRFSGR